MHNENEGRNVLIVPSSKKLRYEIFTEIRNAGRGLVERICDLQNAVARRRRAVPEDHSSELGKLNKWHGELKGMRAALEKIEATLVPGLENKLYHKFDTPELVGIALMRPSIKNVFMELSTYFSGRERSPLTSEAFEELVRLTSLSNSMALIGDAALDLSTVVRYWEPDASEGELTELRAALVSNENLAAVCDDLGLYEARIHLDQRVPLSADTLDHAKGTLLESVFGLIYLESGSEGVMATIPILERL